MAPGAQITLQGETAAFGDLHLGDTLKVEAMAGVVLKLAARRTDQGGFTPTGVVQAKAFATGDAAARLTIQQLAGSTLEAAVAANAAIEVNGHAAGFVDVLVGDAVAITLVEGSITSVRIQRQTSTVQTAFKGSHPAGANSLAVLLTEDAAGQQQAYFVASYATVKLNGQAAALANLAAGDRLRLSLTGPAAVQILATRD